MRNESLEPPVPAVTPRLPSGVEYRFQLEGGDGVAPALELRGDLTTADAILREALEIFGLYGSREYAELTSRASAHADPA